MLSSPLRCGRHRLGHWASVLGGLPCFSWLCSQQLAHRPEAKLNNPGTLARDAKRCAVPCKPLHRRCEALQVEFAASRTICDVRVESVVDAQTGLPVKYGSKTALVTEGYHVE